MRYLRALSIWCSLSLLSTVVDVHTCLVAFRSDQCRELWSIHRSDPCAELDWIPRFAHSNETSSPMAHRFVRPNDAKALLGRMSPDGISLSHCRSPSIRPTWSMDLVQWRLSLVDWFSCSFSSTASSDRKERIRQIKLPSRCSFNRSQAEEEKHRHRRTDESKSHRLFEIHISREGNRHWRKKNDKPDSFTTSTLTRREDILRNSQWRKHSLLMHGRQSSQSHTAYLISEYSETVSKWNIQTSKSLSLWFNLASSGRRRSNGEENTHTGWLLISSERNGDVKLTRFSPAA